MNRHLGLAESANGGSRKRGDWIHSNLREYPNPEEQTFDSFKLSTRGSIRQAPNVISWVITLGKLAKAGDKDVGVILRQWNQTSAKHANINGNKGQAVKNLLELCSEDTLNIVVESVSRWGWDLCPFSEDALSSKKLYPGQHFKSVHSRKWTQRQQVTKETSNLLFQHVVASHANLPESVRRKRTKAQMEARSEMAAVVYHLAEAVCASMPGLNDLVNSAFKQARTREWWQASPAPVTCPANRQPSTNVHCQQCFGILVACCGLVEPCWDDRGLGGMRAPNGACVVCVVQSDGLDQFGVWFATTVFKVPSYALPTRQMGCGVVWCWARFILGR